MPSIAVIDDVLNALPTSVPRRVSGFPPCEICGRKTTNPCAATDSLIWYFGHAKCVPKDYWIPNEDFEHLEAVLDWAYHLAEKSTLGRASWLKLVAYVRPQWLTAAREVMHRYFAASSS
jgi:hypothetical protein